jgi:hypothetical protein
MLLPPKKPIPTIKVIVRMAEAASAMMNFRVDILITPAARKI